VGDILERKMGGLTVRLHRSICIGTANCIKIAPEVFVLDSEHINTFKEDLAGIARDRLIDACDACPVDALTVLDEKGEQLVP
jgi:ferredoxin